MSPMRDVRTTNERTREDRATHPMDAGWLSFAINKLASSKLRFSETITHSLTHLLTGVKCRATSVTKNLQATMMPIWIHLLIVWKSEEVGKNGSTKVFRLGINTVHPWISRWNLDYSFIQSAFRKQSQWDDVSPNEMCFQIFCCQNWTWIRLGWLQESPS